MTTKKKTRGRVLTTGKNLEALEKAMDQLEREERAAIKEWFETSNAVLKDMMRKNREKYLGLLICTRRGLHRLRKIMGVKMPWKSPRRKK